MSTKISGGHNQHPVTAAQSQTRKAAQPQAQVEQAAPAADRHTPPQESLQIAKLPGKAKAPTVSLHGDETSASHAPAKTETSKSLPPTKSVRVSSYGPGLYGNPTANGTRLTPNTVGLAHKSLPLGTVVDVTVNGQTVSAKVIDRGPYVGGRTFDLTAGLIKKLGFRSCAQFGVRNVQVRIHR